MTIKKVLAILAFAAFLFFLILAPSLFSQVLGGWLKEFELFSRNQPILAIGFFVGLAAISVILGPFSSAPTIPFAIAAWGNLTTLLLLLSGWMIGGLAAYTLGYRLGEPLVAWAVGRKRLQDWMSKISPRLDFLTLLLFRLAMPAETGYIFGLLRYQFISYVLITLLAEIPFALLLIFGGGAIISTSVEIIILAAIIWIALIGLALRVFMKRVGEIR